LLQTKLLDDYNTLDSNLVRKDGQGKTENTK